MFSIINYRIYEGEKKTIIFIAESWWRKKKSVHKTLPSFFTSLIPIENDINDEYNSCFNVQYWNIFNYAPLTPAIHFA